MSSAATGEGVGETLSLDELDSLPVLAAEQQPLLENCSMPLNGLSP